MIWSFAAPNGLCTSITESKHIDAVKDPWRRSNRFEEVGQMLLTNQRLDKLAASRTDFADRGMLNGTCLFATYLALHPDEDLDPELDHIRVVDSGAVVTKRKSRRHDDGAVPGPTVLSYVVMAATAQTQHCRTADTLGDEIHQPRLLELIRRFLYDQLNPDSALPGLDVRFTSVHCFKSRSRYSIQRLQPTTLLVIRLVLAECTVNIYGLHHGGGALHLGSTVRSSITTPAAPGSLAWMWFASTYSFHSNSVVSSTLAL
ncbi:hypothetical protein A0H81_01416 [Grifola frondosa]|uniref:Uncharacterized protein n=1 Tax=Grifola frondosa TaxID=5627 RepID=A0A1C7MX56_GRIFR|nr:hypothetical protein A0H81_01416 [Grifola frondosa]